MRALGDRKAHGAENLHAFFHDLGDGVNRAPGIRVRGQGDVEFVFFKRLVQGFCIEGFPLVLKLPVNFGFELVQGGPEGSLVLGRQRAEFF